MNFIKTHKKEFALLVVAGVIVIFCVVLFAIVWFQGSKETYGDRLEGIEDVELSDGYIKDIIDIIKKDRDYVTKVTYNLEGKLLSFLVTVKDETSLEEAKTIGDLIIPNLTKKELEFYDIQLYLLDSNTNKESKYPVIGYKHKTSEEFVWSNN